MFLSRVSISNVRSIESMQIDFTADAQHNRRWTLLLGENGCGKSSVLRSIALLLAGSDALPELLGQPDGWIRNGTSRCRIVGELRTAGGEARTVGLELRRGDSLRETFERNAESLAALDAAIRHSDRNWLVLGYGVSRSLSPNGSSAAISEDTSRPARARGLASMFSPDAALVPLQQWAMDLEYRRGKAALQPLKTALDRLLPDMSLRGIDKKRRQLVFRTVDGLVPLDQLSDGYQNMAAWCGDLLFRLTEAFPDRKDPLGARGLLLIDEIDLHLHPVWRRRLVDFLSQTLPNFQFVATTHSALTAQQSGEGELYVIRRDAEGRRPDLVPFVGEPRKMMLHQLLMSPMFGLESMDSVQIEGARRRVRQLSAKRVTLSPVERTELAQLRAMLKDAPDWDAVPQYAREQTDLLRSIKELVPPSAKVSPTRLRALSKRLDKVS